METLTSLLIAAILAGLVWPHIVRSHSRLFLAIGSTLLALLTQIVALASLQARMPDFAAFLMMLSGLLLLGAIVMLIGAFGGLSITELFQEIGSSFRSLGATRRGFPVSPPPVPPPPPSESEPPRPQP